MNHPPRAKGTVGFFIRIKHVVRPESNNETRYNLAGVQATPPTVPSYAMAQKGKSAAEISNSSARPARRTFNRHLANALKNLGASSPITHSTVRAVGDSASLSGNRSTRRFHNRAPIRWRFPLPARPGGTSCMGW